MGSGFTLDEILILEAGFVLEVVLVFEEAFALGADFDLDVVVFEVALEVVVVPFVDFFAVGFVFFAVDATLSLALVASFLAVLAVSTALSLRSLALLLIDSPVELAAALVLDARLLVASRARLAASSAALRASNNGSISAVSDLPPSGERLSLIRKRAMAASQIRRNATIAKSVFRINLMRKGIAKSPLLKTPKKSKKASTKIDISASQ